MKNIKTIAKLLVVLLFIATSSCTDKCIEGDRVEPPSIFLNLVDATSEENLFENGTFTEAHIRLTDQNSATVQYSFLETVNIIQVFPSFKSDLTSGIALVELLNPDTMELRELQINYTYNQSSGECFTNYTITSVEFLNSTSEQGGLIYTVKI